MRRLIYELHWWLNHKTVRLRTRPIRVSDCTRTLGRPCEFPNEHLLP